MTAFDVVDPATGAVFASAPACTTAELDATIAAAAAAAPGWAALPLDERRARLRACGAALADAAEEVAALLSREQGKPLAAARAEVDLSSGWFGHTADLPGTDEEVGAGPGASIMIGRVPHGVVAAIAPSNFPIILAVCKVAPALLAGNAVVLKPSPETPLSTRRTGELLAAHLPPGVLSVVSGDHALGKALTTHPGIDMVSFTGSVGTGQAIAEQAAGRFLPVVLELGGNDAAVVLPDADVTALAPALFAGAMVNSGQFCAAIKRIYVSGAQAGELVTALAKLASAAVVGDGSDAATEYGPLVSRAELDRVSALVDDAAAAGARVVTGGARLPRPGWFYPPTIVTDLPPGTDLELEEQFGPVIPVIAYDDLDEAISRANGTRYGLGASLWGDAERARALAARLTCGTVWINTHGALRHDTPFGGVRSSGAGVEYGWWGLLEYTRIKVVHELHPGG